MNRPTIIFFSLLILFGFGAAALVGQVQVKFKVMPDTDGVKQICECCGRVKEWIIPPVIWGPAQSIPPVPGSSIEGPTFVRSGVLYSNLQYRWMDEGTEHVKTMRSIKLKDVVKFYRHRAVEEELEVESVTPLPTHQSPMPVRTR